MDYKGLFSFAIGGTIILLAFWDLMARVQALQYGYNTVFLIRLIVQDGVLSLVGFLLVGYGLLWIIKSTKMET